MKPAGFAKLLFALIATAGIAFFSLNTARSVVAQSSAATPARPLVFVPGLLGSRLCTVAPDGTEAEAWGSVESMGQFPTLAVTPGSDVVPCGLIREVAFLGVFRQDFYGPFMARLGEAGYVEGTNLFVFDYDWRLSILDNAERLAAFVSDEVPDGRFDIIGHSMGGLIARTYAIESGGERIARMVSAGSPWLGSVQVFELLAQGWGLGTNLLGGIENFRRTIVSFPSSFELMPHYAGCCNAPDDRNGFDAASKAEWLALNWPGIGAADLPDLRAGAARQAQLRAILARPLPASIEEALVIGVDQRTPQHYELAGGEGEGEARLSVRTSWEGDGTVMRDSALLPARVTYPTSFATHDAILSDASVQDFVIAALGSGPVEAIRMVPVRERTPILTALGEIVELIGIAVATDQPAYPTGALAKVTVHLRLAVDDPVEVAAIKATVARPDGTAAPLVLAPDPDASDPAVPLEQSFSAQVETGNAAGSLVVTVALDNTAGGEPRRVTRSIPVLAP
jgi:pimeloyl-ACP methyl ester carboxylesterase